MKKAYSFLFLLLSLAAMPQRLAQKMADDLFNNMAYASAVDYYKDLAARKDPCENNLRRLAVCYYKLQSYEKAEKAYARLVSLYPQVVSEEDLFNYIQCLKSQDKYKEADGLLNRLSEKNKSNSFLVAHRLNPSYVNELRRDSLRYKIYPVNSLNTRYSEFFPYLYGKDKDILIVSNRRNVSVRNRVFAFDNTYFTDTYVAKMKDSLHFSDVKPASDLNIRYHDGPVIISPDGNTMYLTRSNYFQHKASKSSRKRVNLKLLIFKKTEKGIWDEGTVFPFSSDEYSVGHAAVSQDGKRLYFVSDMPGGYGETDLWYSDLVNGQWQKPVNLGSDINTGGQEMFPFVNDQGILFFSSNGYAGLGGLDICYAFPGNGNFMEGKLLGYPINTRFDDFGFYVNPDLRTGYFSSGRDGGQGKDDIYYFSSASPLFGIYVEGRILNGYSKQGIAGITIRLLNAKQQVIDSLVADRNGKYHLTIPDPSKSYALEVETQPGYSPQLVPLSALRTGKNEKDILLYPDYLMSCLVTEGKSHVPLDSVKVSLEDRSGNEKVSFMTGANGRFEQWVKNRRAGDVLHYSLKMEKPGYITSVQDLDLTLDTAVRIDLHKIVNAGLERMKKGTDIGKIVQISPIYFDVAKWDIKPEAARELDKIVNVMRENPTMKIELGSHTDCRSDKAYNLKLSDKRAKASANYIISRGIDQTRIYGKGYGETKLINKCECEGQKVVPCTEEQHQQNRRTEFIVVKF